jgi:hypothetical protein
MAPKRESCTSPDLYRTAAGANSRFSGVNQHVSEPSLWGGFVYCQVVPFSLGGGSQLPWRWLVRELPAGRAEVP